MNDAAFKLHRDGRLAEAAAAYQAAINFDKRNPHLLANYSSLLFRMGKLESSLQMAKWAVLYGPKVSAGYNNAGICLTYMDRYYDALRYYKKASELDPSHPMILSNYGDALNNVSQHAEAIEVLTRALSLKSDAAIQANLGMAHWGAGDFATAETELREAIKKAPTFLTARKNLGMVLLTQGKYHEGWEEYEARFKADNIPIRSNLPAWTGKGNFVLSLCEQGLGDHILHASMLGDFSDSIVTWEADQRLVPILKRSYPTVTVIPYSEAPEATDYFHTHACSVGRFLRPDLASFPKHKGYLIPDPSRVAQMRERFPGKLVGVSWASSNSRIGGAKTILLREWEPIFSVEGYAFVNLQYGKFSATGSPLVEPGFDTTLDIEGLAALISICERVVTVSNTTAHLAGALGVPTTVLIPGSIGKLWYWGTSDKTPWYPSATLLRNTKGWGPVMDQVASELKAASVA